MEGVATTTPWLDMLQKIAWLDEDKSRLYSMQFTS